MCIMTIRYLRRACNPPSVLNNYSYKLLILYAKYQKKKKSVCFDITWKLLFFKKQTLDPMSIV